MFGAGAANLNALRTIALNKSIYKQASLMFSMSSSIQAIIFDFGGVLINWDPHNLFDKYFANNSQATNNFLTEIDFSSWNLAQDEGYPFSKAVLETFSPIPAIRPSHPRL